MMHSRIVRSFFAHSTYGYRMMVMNQMARAKRMLIRRIDIALM